MQVHCQVCPVCKAGIEQSKVGPEKLHQLDLCTATLSNKELWNQSPQPHCFPNHMPDQIALCTTVSLCCPPPKSLACMQVIPIYGRGGDNSDPRQVSLPAKPEDQDGPVPNRPPGQRMAPVQVIMACLGLPGWLQTPRICLNLRCL